MFRKNSIRGVFILTVVIVTMMALAPMAGAADELVTNGDFESGNAGFTSDYGYVSTTGPVALWDEYKYAVGFDPYDYHYLWTSFKDHTTGDGKMMIVNGRPPPAGDDKSVVWRQDVTLPKYGAETPYPLLAGQTWEIGEVLVKNSTDEICFKFVITDTAAIAEGWLITEAHAAIGKTLLDIPQTKNNNPIPGQFPINEKLDPGLVETPWYCIDYGGETFLAAHAKLVGNEKTMSLVSSTDTNVVLPIPGSAVPANEPFNYPDCASYTPDDGIKSLWDNGIGTVAFNYFNAEPKADWIWDSLNPTDPVNGNVVTFENQFTIPGLPTGGSLVITADNGFTASLNATPVGTAELGPGFPGTLKEFLGGIYTLPKAGDWGVSSQGWQSVETYPLAGLVEGTNTLEIVAGNEYMAPDDKYFSTSPYTTGPVSIDPLPGFPSGTNPCYNPAGLIFKADVNYLADSETGWGEGTTFGGKNWATYMEYEPTDAMYQFTMWVASSYPTNPAQLTVNINGNACEQDSGVLPTTPGTWIEVQKDCDLGAATSALIEIRDLTLIASGDDFVIDDISLVKLP